MRATITWALLTIVLSQLWDWARLGWGINHLSVWDGRSWLWDSTLLLGYIGVFAFTEWLRGPHA